MAAKADNRAIMRPRDIAGGALQLRGAGSTEARSGGRAATCRVIDVARPPPISLP